MGGARNLTRGRSGSCPFPQTAPRRSSALVHRPTAVEPNRQRGKRGEGRQTDLVVEPAARLEELEESSIGGTAPEVHVSDLKVAPDWCRNVNTKGIKEGREGGRDAQWQRL